MEPRLSLVTLGVADVARSRTFYERLGFTASPASQEGIVFFPAGGVVLALYGRDALAEDAHLPPNGGGAFGGIALAHNVHKREDVAERLAKAEAAGGHILKPAQDVFWGGYSGYFADPDGHPWEVVWNPFVSFDADGRLLIP